MKNHRHGNKNNHRHGGANSHLWQVWCRMRQRCSNERRPDYIGDRISVCARWLGRDGFSHFAQDVGLRPSRLHEFIRKNTEADFTADNCIWATKTETRQYRPRELESNYKHGMTKTPTWKSWRAMRERCENPRSHGFVSYGARGITVCDRWSDFSNFLVDMGERPAGMTIDRIDSKGNYEPRNCRWATATTQSRNTSSVRFEPHEPAQIRWLLSEGYSQAEIARLFEVDRSVIGHIARGRTWREDCQ